MSISLWVSHSFLCFSVSSTVESRVWNRRSLRLLPDLSFWGFSVYGVGNSRSHCPTKATSPCPVPSHRVEWGGRQRGAILRLAAWGGEGHSPGLLAAVRLSPGAAVSAAGFTRRQKIEAVSGQHCEWLRQQSHVSRHCPVWALGVEVTDFVERPGKNIPWVILKPLEIFGKCEQLVPHIFSLISGFFKKWLCWGVQLYISSPPSGSLSRALVFQYEEVDFLHSPWHGACILKTHQLSLLFACWFVSFHTPLKPPLCSERAVPSCEERGGVGRDVREHHLFSQQTLRNVETEVWALNEQKPEVFRRNLNSLACLEIWSWPFLHHAWWYPQVTSQNVGIGMWGLNHHHLWACVQLGSRSISIPPKWVEQRFA